MSATVDAWTELLGALCQQAIADEEITVVINNGRYALVYGDTWPELAAAGNVRRIKRRELQLVVSDARFLCAR